MVYRSLVVGLLGALVLLVAAPTVVPQRSAATPQGLTQVGRDVFVVGDRSIDDRDLVTVVDVSRRAAGNDPVPLLGLHPGERIAAVDGVAADTVTFVGRWAQAFPGDYVDVEVTGGTRARRILVLVHP